MPETSDIQLNKNASPEKPVATDAVTREVMQSFSDGSNLKSKANSENANTANPNSENASSKTAISKQAEGQEATSYNTATDSKSVENVSSTQIKDGITVEVNRLTIDSPFKKTGQLPSLELILGGFGSDGKILQADKVLEHELNEALLLDFSPGSENVMQAKSIDLANPNQEQLETKTTGDRPERVIQETEAGVREVREASKASEDKNQAIISLDERGRIKRIEYASEDRIREIEYFGDTNQIKRFSHSLNGVTNHQHRESPQSNQWKSSDRFVRDFVGQAQIKEDGTFQLKFEDGTKDGSWQTRWADNTTTNDTIHANGSRSSFDENGNIVRYQNEYGAVAKAEYISTQQSKIEIIDDSGTKTVWTKSDKNTWTNDRSDNIRKNMQLLESGHIAYEGENGSICKERIDGHLEVQNKDNSISEFDKAGSLIKTTQPNGDYRTFEYKDNQLEIAYDFSKNEKRTAFQRYNPETRANISVDGEGNIQYVTDNGHLVVRQSNGTNIERDEHNKILKLALRDERIREYNYDETGDRLEQIVDTSVGKNGETVSLILTREAGSQENGDSKNVFAGKSHLGKEIERTIVKINEDGTYNFKNPNQPLDERERVAPIGGYDNALSVWEASFKKDSLDRIEEVTTDKKARHYEYFEDKNELKKIVITDKTKGETTTWERDSSDSNRWYKLNDDGSRSSVPWRGQVKVASNGTHLYRASDHYGRYSQTWNGSHPDGSEVTATEEKNGTLVFRDQDKNVSGALLKDSSQIIVSNKDASLKMTVFNANLDESTTWTKGNREPYQWVSDNPTKSDSRKNLRFDDSGALIFEDNKGRTNTEALDGTLVVRQEGGGALSFDQDHNLVKINYRGTERNIYRDNGVIKSITETNALDETRTIFEHGGRLEDRTNFSLNDDGDFSYRSKSGEQITLRANGLKITNDAEGSVLKVERPDGTTREFSYFDPSPKDGHAKEVKEIRDTRPQKAGQDSPRVTTWTRAVVNGEVQNEWQSKTEKGTDRAPRKDIKLTEDGNFEYRLVTDSTSDKPRMARLGGGGIGDGNYLSESVEDGHYNLLDAMEAQVEKPRVERMEKMMKKFESRMADQYELMTLAGIPENDARQQLDDAMTQTYDQMVRLITSPDQNGQFHNHQQRIFLAENFLYHAADPTTIEQGNTGTCWWESSYAVAMERNTNHLARFVTDLALGGEYKSTAGAPDRYGTVTQAMHKIFSPRYGELDLRQSRNGFDMANGWSIETADQDSKRSPISQIIDNYGPAVLGWRSQGRPNSGGHGEAWRILYMMTGRKVVDHGSARIGRAERVKLLREGGYTASGGGHMWGYCMRKVGDEWHVIRNDQYQNRDRVVARITDLKDWVDNGTRDNIRKSWKPYSPNNPDNQPYITDKEDNDYPDDNPNRPLRPRIRNWLQPRRPVIRRFFRSF